MSVQTRLLYSSASGDRWYLARSAGSSHVFVRHEPNRQSGGRQTDIEIGQFLMSGGNGPEHQELLRLIATLIDAGVS